MINKALLRKISCIMTVLILAFSLSACGSKAETKKPKPSQTSQRQTVNKPAKENISAYYPLKVGNHWEYKGTGNEYAAYKEDVVFAEGNKYQVMTDNGGTRMAHRYEVSANQIVTTYREGEVYNDKNILAEPSNENIVILKRPITVGTSWTNGNNHYEITQTDATVAVPAGTFNNCVVVKVTNPQEKTYTLDYYKKGVGLVKTEFVAENGDKIMSELEKYTLK